MINTIVIIMINSIALSLLITTEEALEEALEDTSELEETVRELIEGKNAVTGR